jgi:hypothetical protein
MHKGSALEIPQTVSKSSLFLVYLLAAALFTPGPILLAHLIAPRIYGASQEAISAGSRPRLDAGECYQNGRITVIILRNLPFTGHYCSTKT